MKQLLIILSTIFFSVHLTGQVKIGGTGSPHANSVLELDGGTNKGLLLPRLTDAQMNAMNNVPDGMMIYNTSVGKIFIRRANTWEIAGGVVLPHDKSYTVDNNYILKLVNLSSNDDYGAILGQSVFGNGVVGWSDSGIGVIAHSNSGYGMSVQSTTGTALYASSINGPAITTGSGNVGIGLVNPGASLHVKKQTQTLFLLENSYPLGLNVRADMQFKTGNYFTGVISTIGTSAQNARLGFHTGAHTTAGFLIERMSILNNGNIGINNITPSARLDVVGTAEFNSSGGSEKAIIVNGESVFNQSAAAEAAITINGRIQMSGTNPRAFVVTANNNFVFYLDHPDLNGNPNAIILVTPRGTVDDAFKGQLAVTYDYWIDKWCISAVGHQAGTIYNDVNIKLCNGLCIENVDVASMTYSKFEIGQQFNVLVIGN